MALRREALGYGDEASQYGFESYKQYKKENRGGLKGAGKGASYGAGLGSTIGGTLGSFTLPGIGTVAGTAIGAVGGAAIGSTIGAITENRKMKKEYLKYAKQMTEQGMSRKAAEAEAAKQEAAYRKTLSDQRAAEMERQRALYSVSTTQPIVGGELPMYKKGGVAKMVTINVEKGELAVDPRTMKVIMDFNDMPKHPKGKDVINQKGNVKVPVGTIIIPADMRKDFLKAKPEQRVEMAGELVEKQREGEEKEMPEGSEMEGEEMPQGQGMQMQQGMGQGQGMGMMAMMGGEGEEEGGEEMGKMGNGGYVKKYAAGDMVLDDVTTPRTDFNKLSGNVTTPTNASIYYDPSGNPYSYNAYGEAVAIRPGTEATYDPTKNVRELSVSTEPKKSGISESAKSASGLVGGLGTAVGIIASAGAQKKLGEFQIQQATKGLSELQKQKWAKYLPTAELEQQKLDTAAARERAKYGFSPQELAARQQQVAQSQRTAYQRARESGLTGAGQAILGALGSQRLQALNEMAIQDARLREQKAQYADSSQRSLAQQYQSLANQQTAQDIRYRTMQEQAYGAGLKTGYENVYGSKATLGAGIGYGVGAVAGAGLDKYLDLIG